MRLPKPRLQIVSRLAWPAVAAGMLVAVTLERSPQGSLTPGACVRERLQGGTEWTWEVVGRADDGRYELRRGKVLMLAEPREVVRAE